MAASGDIDKTAHLIRDVFLNKLHQSGALGQGTPETVEVAHNDDYLRSNN